MTPLTGTELAEARKRASARFQVLAMMHKPEGWTPDYHNKLKCEVWATKHFATPRPVTRKSLYVFLCACAKAMAYDERWNNGPPAPKEPADFAVEIMRRHGIPVPRNHKRLVY